MPNPHRAPKGQMHDLVIDGVKSADLKERGDRAVYKALVSTASSAVQKGHTFDEWFNELGASRSVLGRQARTRSNGKEHTRQQYNKKLLSAWAAAEKWVANAPPPFTRRDVTAQIAAARDWVADADTPLDDNDRAVLAAACRVAAEIGTTRPALPRRRLVAETGLGERSIRSTLERLHRQGLLLLVDPGKPSVRPSSEKGGRRAALYRLPDAAARSTYLLYRETRSVGPPAQVYGTPRNDGNGTPPQVYGTPSDPTEETAVVTVTISATDPDQLAAAIAALQGNSSVQVDTPPGRRHLSVVKPDKQPRRQA